MYGYNQNKYQPYLQVNTQTVQLSLLPAVIRSHIDFPALKRTSISLPGR